MNKEEQEDEVQVLQAVYVDDFVDLRTKDAWKVWRPPEFSITLHPSNTESSANSGEVSIDLHVKLTNEYPHKPPCISFAQPRQVSDKHVALLTKRIESLAQGLCGQVMIMEICLSVQEFLRDMVNEMKKSDLRFKSFHEGMLTHQLEQESLIKDLLEKQKAAQLQQQNTDWQQIEQEIKRREEEKRLSLLKRKQSEGDPEARSAGTSFDSASSSRSPKSKITDQSRTIRGSSVPSDKNIAKSRDYSTFGKIVPGSKLCLKTLDTTSERALIISGIRGSCHPFNISYDCFDQSTSNNVSVSEWTLKWLRKCSNSSHLNREIQAVDKEFQSLVKLGHPSLTSYVSLFVRQNQELCSFYVVKSAEIDMLPLNVIYERRIAVCMTYVQKLSNDVLSALEYLHGKGVLHKDIDLDCMFDCRTKFLLSDFSVRKRMKDLCHFFKNDCQYAEYYDEKVSSGRNFYGMGKISQKLDIFLFGVSLTALASGQPIEDNDVFKIPNNLPSGFKNFIRKMVAFNEESRWTASQLLKHPFLKNQTELDDERVRINQVDTTENDENELNTVDTSTFLSLPVNPQLNRLENEFDILKFLGRGGFGDVVKVRNKLDNGIYAMKRIVLQPNNRTENKKITREVKLLSRLNHENVVRYYNSWIERASTKTANRETSPRKKNSSTHEQKVKPSHDLVCSDYDDIERLAPPPVTDSVEWSVSYSPDFVNGRRTEDDSDDDESNRSCMQNIASSLGNLFFDPKCRSTSCSEGSDFDDIVFAEKDENSIVKVSKPDAIDSETSPDSTNLTNNSGNREETDIVEESFVQILYIQMEFCERSTLRQAIDDGELFTDAQKTWRLFREICEGLAYIHRQGCIHRDLKPVNIFLDSNDHAKIGDFGLATHNQAINTDLTVMAMSADFLNDSNDVAKIEFTTKIGTALYISPELSTGGKKPYTQRVDIYSLGIILFEMFYRPLGTGMERVKILSDLRLSEIRIPDDFGRQCPSTKNLVKLLQWMLQHEAEKRPLADELLHSELLPPVEMQKNDFELAINNTLSRTQTRQYRWLINAIMEQKPSTVQDYVYDDDIYPKAFSIKSTLNTRIVADKLKRLFSTHGIIEVDTPLLLPKNKVLTENLESRVDLMDESGLVLHLPYDLRTPFARYIIRCDIAHLKRFSIGTVYRNPGRLESHPRQITECALDFVTTPNCCPASIAEILSIISDVVCEFPSLQDKNYSIRINHTSITKAIIMQFGVQEKEKRRKVMQIISDFASNKISKQRRDQKLQLEMKLSDKSMCSFLDLLDTEDNLSKLSSKLRVISKKSQAQACSLSRDALHELDVVINLCESLKVRLPIVVSPRLLFALHEYKGIVYQVAYDQKLKRSGTQIKTNILAAGGRYDRLLKKFRKSMPGKPSTLQPTVSAVGVSIAFDTIVNMICPLRLCQYDVLICSVGRKLLLKEKLSLAKSLWAMNVKTDFIQEPVANLEDLQEHCRKSNVEYLIIFKDSELNAVRVKSFSDEKILEKKLNALDVPSYLQEKFACLAPKNDMNEGSSILQTRTHLDSTGSINVQSSGVANFSNVNVHFATTEKLTVSSKKRYEFQMCAAVGSIVRRFSNRETLNVILTNLPSSVLQYFVGTIDLSNENSYDKSAKELAVKFNKQKQSILLLIDEIWKLKSENGTILVYSYLDDVYKVML